MIHNSIPTKPNYYCYEGEVRQIFSFNLKVFELFKSILGLFNLIRKENQFDLKAIRKTYSGFQAHKKIHEF
jgi:hypothetical protein